MSDVDLRDLERAWLTTGADAAGLDYLSSRARAGQLEPDALELLARLGLGAALARLGDDAPRRL